MDIDTVVRFPSATFLLNGFYMPEMDKLYIYTKSCEIIVMEGAAYQLKARIPHPWGQGVARFTMNHQRRKLYFGATDSLLVIDAVADTAIGWLPSALGSLAAYSSTLDRLYVGQDTLCILDCATDTIVGKISPPLPGYAFGVKSWDSLSNKLYVGLSKWGYPPQLAAYDCNADTLTGLIDVSSVVAAPGPMNFNYAFHKAYFGPSAPAPFSGIAGVIDTERDSLVKVFPIAINNGMLNPIAVDIRDNKVYVSSSLGSGQHAETLYVIDCATDSILKRCPFPGRGAMLVRWVPWSNRVYLDCNQDSCLKVLDCSTDSFIVTRLQLGYWGAQDIQLDPTHERIFAIGAESTSVHVLRDVVPGVAEGPALSPSPGAPLKLRELRDAVELEYQLETAGWVDVSVFDLFGRRIKTLVSERQMPGRRCLKWDRTGTHGKRSSHGAYFIIVNTGSAHRSSKTMVR